jgi:phytol kinase
MSDWFAILLSFVYIFTVLASAEGLRFWRGYSPEFTRKVVHISVGMWAISTVYLFENVWLALVPPGSFIILNYISYRRGLFQAMETDNKANLGTVYFPLAFCLVLLTFWPTKDLIVAALMPMTWGDAMASILGQRYGHIKYSVLGQQRSVEGSVSMAIFSFISTFLALWLLPPLTGLWLSLGLALIIALFATFTEAISPWGLDNLTVTTIVGLVLFVWVT